MSTPLIYKKMSLVMSEIKSVGKDQKNQAQGFKFRGIDQFVNAMYPALVKHGVFMAPEVVKEEHTLKEVTRSNGKEGVDKHVHLLVKYTFYAEDGSSVSVGPIASEGLDSGDKATNKALSAALKYALIQTFSVPTEDMAEADLETPEIGRSAPKEGPEKAPSERVTKAPVTPSGFTSPETPTTKSPTTVPSADQALTEAAAEAPKRSSFKPRTTPVANGASRNNHGF